MAPFNDIMKELVVQGVDLATDEGAEAQPEAAPAILAMGAAVSFLVSTLWPDSESGQPDLWEQIKAQVEELIDEKIDENNWNTLQGHLTSLNSFLSDYTHAIDLLKNDPSSKQAQKHVRAKYKDAQQGFETLSGDFMAYGEWTLPLFAQMANLHLYLLNDCALYGAENWKMSETDMTQNQTWLQEYIKTYTEYAVDYCQAYVTEWLDNLPAYEGLERLMPGEVMVQWNVFNKKFRTMTTQVFDYAFYWPYLDPQLGPPPALTREIYSDYFGTYTDNYQLWKSGSTNPALSGLKVGAAPDPDKNHPAVNYPFISAVQQQFGGEWTDIVPSQSDYLKLYPWGPIPPNPGPLGSDNPVIEVSVTHSSVTLKFQDGTSQKIGTESGTTTTYSNYAHINGDYYGDILSEIYMKGGVKVLIPGDRNTVEVKQPINNFVFGFRKRESYPPDSPTKQGPLRGATGILACLHQGSLWRVDPDNNYQYTRLGNAGDWVSTAAMTVLPGDGSSNDTLYIVQGSSLFSVDPASGAVALVGKEGIWDDTDAMTALSGALYVVQKGTLYKVDPVTGVPKPFGPAGVWDETAAMTTLSEHLYVVQKDTLYTVDASGKNIPFGNKGVWGNTTAMATWGQPEALVVIQKGTLYTVDQSGVYTPLGTKGTWENTAAMTGLSGNLYIVKDDLLYRLGDSSPIGQPQIYRGKAAAMTTAGNKLYIVT